MTAVLDASLGWPVFRLRAIGSVLVWWWGRRCGEAPVLVAAGVIGAEQAACLR